jgi:hypothetical protein
VHGELIDTGLIIDVDFTPQYVDDPDHPSYKAWQEGKDCYGDHVVKKAIHQARPMSVR